MATKIKFNLKDKSEKETLINLIYRYDGKRLKYSTSLKVPPEYWNDKKQRVRETIKFIHYQEYNNILNSYEKKTEKIFLTFKEIGRYPTIQEFRDELNKVSGKRVSNPDSPQELFSFIDYFKNKRVNTATKDYATSTLNYYSRLRDILLEYEKERRIKLEFHSFNIKFYDDFLEFLYSEPRCYSINYSGNVIKTLKTILNAAVREGINFRPDYKKFKKPKQEVDNIYLSIKELTTIFDYDFSDNPRLERVRDLFIVGAFTGLRYSDFSNIKPEYIKTLHNDDGKELEVISLDTQKTGERVIIPLHPFVKKIRIRYKEQTHNGFPPSMSNQKMNDYLKEVAKIVGLDEEVQLKKSRAGKQSILKCRKYEVVSTHTARRSFATNAYKSGIPSIAIMQITGHRTETAFMKYIKVTKEENAFLMANTSFYQG